jgi:hypothetical protein
VTDWVAVGWVGVTFKTIFVGIIWLISVNCLGWAGQLWRIDWWIDEMVLSVGQTWLKCQIINYTLILSVHYNVILHSQSRLINKARFFLDSFLSLLHTVRLVYFVNAIKMLSEWIPCNKWSYNKYYNNLSVRFNRSSNSYSSLNPVGISSLWVHVFNLILNRLGFALLLTAGWPHKVSSLIIITGLHQLKINPFVRYLVYLVRIHTYW